MNKYLFSVFFSLIIFQVFASGRPEKISELKLWYKQPAQKWTEALPIGNGRLGAMVFGGVKTEQIQLNEQSVWTGGPIQRANPEALQNLGRVRQLLFDGKYAEGNLLAQAKIMGKTLGQGAHTYQTLGDLYLEFEGLTEVTDYNRTLDLRTAVTTTKFESEGVKYTREVFASSPDEVIVIKLSASAKGKLNFAARLERPGEAEMVAASKNQLLMTGFAEYEGKGTHFASVVHFNNKGGSIVSNSDRLVVKNADEVEILISGRTDYWGEEETKSSANDILKAREIDFRTLKSNHISKYQKLFSRVNLTLNGPDTLNLPTNERLERIKKGATDDHFTELYFQFGRYLLISSSRPGGLPANLQGIWDPSLSPPWNADYHININIQMNYWLAMVTNLAECEAPFFDFVDGLRKNGSFTAKEVYGCRGFVAHHTTDVWKYTDPIGNRGYGLWPMGAAWCSDHFWEYYDYTGDKKFLKEKAYPVLKDASLFFVDFLVKNPATGLLVSGPSISPENKFIVQNDNKASVSMGPTMDHQIIRELFNNCIKASALLGIDREFADTLKTMLGQLTPSQIGSDGRVMEWSQELKEREPGHRHMSHLYALYPGEEFTNPDDPKWMEAARKTIEVRLANGGGHTGWSRTWIINFFARLKDGQKAFENIQALFTKSTLTNLFDNHSPFQIDGNFGATAGMAEMLLQSHNEIIQILPALPPSWKKGDVKGLRARGGFEIDMAWDNNELTRLEIQSLLGNKCKIVYRNKNVQFETVAGQRCVLDRHLTKK
jgi:alpha-L-fucosidase 2